MWYPLIQSENKAFIRLYFADSQGKLPVMVPYTKLADDFNASGREWYQQAQKQNKLIYTDTYIDEITNGSCVTVAMPVVNSQGEPIGVLGADLSLDELTTLANSKDFSEQGQVYMTDGKGKVIIHPNQNWVFEGHDLSALKHVQQSLAGNSGFETYIDHEGNEKIVHYTSIAANGWGLYVEKDKSALVGT